MKAKTKPMIKITLIAKKNKGKQNNLRNNTLTAGVAKDTIHYILILCFMVTNCIVFLFFNSIEYLSFSINNQIKCTYLHLSDTLK